MPRPFIQKHIFELQEYFEAVKGNLTELKKLAAELKHRKVPKAVALAKKVQAEIDGLTGYSSDGGPDKSKQEQPLQPEHKVIECHGCGQKLRIELDSVTRNYTCPKCKSAFHASFENRVLSVVFQNNASHSDDTKNEDDRHLTEEEAYKLFGTDESTPWESIELTRRRLIQQYHPDKVAALGPKLRAVAEAEGKRINKAYDMLRKLRGL
jgi:DNA-directed RNA polymerase subunit RPC12/RpoP